MTADQPPNPYAPTAAPLSDGTTATKRPGWLTRLGAIVLGLLAYPLAGTGLYVTGRQRAFLGWIVAGLVALTVVTVAVRTFHPRLAVAAIAAAPLIALAALIHTGFARFGQVPTTRHAWLAAIGLFLAARAGTLIVKHTLVESFSVPSGSMIPTVLVGDQMMVRKGNDNIARGDVVLFNYPRERNLNYVKRVVAVGGDTVAARAGSVIVNGVELPQTPSDEPCPPLEHNESCIVVREANGTRSYSVLRTEGPARDTDTVTVPAGHVYVLGDNRNNSHDSRHFGPVPLDAVEGTASLIYFSTAPGGSSRIGHGIQ